MNAARVIHGIAAFMLLGVAFVMLREFGINYKFGQIGAEYAKYGKELRNDALPWISALVLPFTPIAWWSALTPLFCSIGVAVRVPASSPVSLAIHWLSIVIIVSVVVFGSFAAYLKITAVMGFPLISPPTSLEIGVNAALLIASTAWMTRGFILVRRG
jgi:hypothetical protein